MQSNSNNNNDSNYNTRQQHETGNDNVDNWAGWDENNIWPCASSLQVFVFLWLLLFHSSSSPPLLLFPD